MAFRFPEASAWHAFARLLRHQVGGTRDWHNRGFASGQSIEKEGSTYAIRWTGRGVLRARCLSELPRAGECGSIVASGPSIRRLRRPERLFDHPVACVNGSVVLAAELGRPIDYYIVSDHRFILERPDLFRAGTSLAKAVVLGPMSTFAAMLLAPDALRGTNLFYRENLRRPFKRRRPSVADLRRDPLVIAHPSGDPAFSLAPARGTFPAGTVVFDALQVLFGIGYRQLFMFGVDLTDGPRFYRESSPTSNELAGDYARRIEPAFELVAEYLRLSGRRLFNASPESRLPDTIIPKADGNDLLDRLEWMASTKTARRPARVAA